MVKRGISNKAILDRLDKLEKSIELTSGMFLLFSLAVGFFAIHITENDFWYFCIAILSYIGAVVLLIYSIVLHFK